MLKLKVERFKTAVELVTFLKGLLQKQDKKLVREAFKIYLKNECIHCKIKEKNPE